jgi:hypothetical protein
VAQVMADSSEPAHSFPAISAFITSFAREYMRDAIIIAGRDNVYYMATDSLILNESGYSRLLEADMIHDWHIGKFKLLGKHRHLEVQHASNYTLDGKTTASGLAGVAAKAKLLGKEPEIFDTVTQTIAAKPSGTIGVSRITPPPSVPDYRGNIDQYGFWSPFRVTMDVDFTDRPHRFAMAFGDSPDTGQDRTLVLVDV